MFITTWKKFEWYEIINSFSNEWKKPQFTTSKLINYNQSEKESIKLRQIKLLFSVLKRWKMYCIQHIFVWGGWGGGLQTWSKTFGVSGDIFNNRSTYRNPSFHSLQFWYFETLFFFLIDCVLEFCSDNAECDLYLDNHVFRHCINQSESRQGRN